MPVSLYDEFVKGLLPGNYALTKSMELTKIKSSGTLWYTKKFLTLYYYIFLSGDIMTRSCKDEIIKIFDRYIESLPAAVRSAASRFFYPEADAVNLKSAGFNFFSGFAGYSDFSSPSARQDYYNKAKKYYFALLMGSGGQTGVKKLLKQVISSPGFVYSPDTMKKAISDCAVKALLDDVNTKHEISDNSIKYIFSSKAIEKLCRISLTRPVKREDILSFSDAFPLEKPIFSSIENDMIAFIRNERQILYYYGFFHSKSTGAHDFEFSSLTPVGELALFANANEFSAVWEHQKIKMLSQPETAEINSVKLNDLQTESFAISYNPYFDIIDHLLRRGSLTEKQYKYILSRKKHTTDSSLWSKEDGLLFDSLDSIADKIHSFGRKRDSESEDSHKELLKYLLGLRGDLPMDCNAHPTGVLRFVGNTVTVENRAALNLLWQIYSSLCDYKVQKYSGLFAAVEDDLKRRYAASANGKKDAPNPKTKIYWDLYNIHPDKLIMLSAVIASSALSMGITELKNLGTNMITPLCAHIYDNYKTLLSALSITSKASLKAEVKRALSALQAKNYSAYLSDEAASPENSFQAMAQYKAESAGDLISKIKTLSASATVTPSKKRKRRPTLVSLMKSYYLRLSSDGTLSCECCKEPAFITSANEPYVEFHHLIPFNIVYGPDHYLNLFALCPLCHRKLHFQSAADKALLYDRLNSSNYLSLSFVQRLKELKYHGLLRSYHLEYLLADNAISVSDYNAVSA